MDGDSANGRVAGLTALALALALAPALAAVWWHRGFVTQDGPAHLYNAHVLNGSGDPASPFAAYFEVRRDPLPNWAGHLALMGLAAALPPRAADRAMTTFTLVSVAVSVSALRRRVAGGRETSPISAQALAAVLALNVSWLLGFGSFLMGASLFALTLAVWWSGRDGGWSPRRGLALAGLTVLGYVCHLVSLGLTAVGLVVLELATPADGRRQRLGRAAATAVGLAPLLPLGAVYLGLMRRGGGGFAPEWKHLERVFSARAWVTQLTWVDPISLARKDYLPLVGTIARWHHAVAPVVWLGAALALAVAAAFAAGGGPFRDRERRGWWVLSALLLAAGVAGPDTLGPTHGEYLQQRVVLLGLVALAPVSRMGSGRLGRASSAALGVALALQLATVWDYAVESDRTAGALLAAAPEVGAGRRVATRLTGITTPFRANPLLHADCALGVGTGNIIWGDYETRFYYFPVQFRAGLDRPDPKELEELALDNDPDAAAKARRTQRWAALLERHHPSIDVVVAWGDDPSADEVTSRWFDPVPTTGGVGGRGPVRVFKKPPPSTFSAEPKRPRAGTGPARDNVQ